MNKIPADIFILDRCSRSMFFQIQMVNSRLHFIIICRLSGTTATFNVNVRLSCHFHKYHWYFFYMDVSQLWCHLYIILRTHWVMIYCPRFIQLVLTQNCLSFYCNPFGFKLWSLIWLVFRGGINNFVSIFANSEKRDHIKHHRTDFFFILIDRVNDGKNNVG